MARGSKIKKVVLKSGKVVYRTTVDAGDDPKTGKRKQKLLTADTKGELEKEAAKILADVARGTYFEPEKKSFSEYLDYWLETYGKPNLGVRTYESYQSIIDKHLKPGLGSIPLTRLLPVHIQNYYSEAQTGGRADNKKSKDGNLSSNTVYKHHRLIFEALHHAVKWGMLVRNVAEQVEPPKKKKPEISWFTQAEVKTILQATEGAYLYMPTYLAVTTGMRLGEVLGLRWSDLNLKGEFLSVVQTLKQAKAGLVFGPPKSRASRRRIDLFLEVVTELKKYQHEYRKKKLATELWQDNDLVCCLQDGSPIPIGNVSPYWKIVVKRALGRDAHFHMLRHTAATMMLERGVPLKDVSEMLGHSSIAITADTYGHVTPAGRKRAALALGDGIFGNDE